MLWFQRWPPGYSFLRFIQVDLSHEITHMAQSGLEIVDSPKRRLMGQTELTLVFALLLRGMIFITSVSLSFSSKHKWRCCSSWIMWEIHKGPSSLVPTASQPTSIWDGSTQKSQKMTLVFLPFQVRVGYRGNSRDVPSCECALTGIEKTESCISASWLGKLSNALCYSVPQFPQLQMIIITPTEWPICTLFAGAFPWRVPCPGKLFSPTKTGMVNALYICLSAHHIHHKNSGYKGTLTFHEQKSIIKSILNTWGPEIVLWVIERKTWQ